MKSKTSFFDWNLLKKNVSRFAPAWAILTLLLFLSIPLPLLRGMNDEREMVYRLQTAQEILDVSYYTGIVFAFCAAMVIASLVFKYMHRDRDAYMMHAFPMTRCCQFLTNAVSGLLFWLVPILFIGLCEIGVLTVHTALGLSGLVWERVGQWLLAFLCFYGIALFCMHLSGRGIIAEISYIALNFMFLVLPLLFLLLVNCYFKGFDYTIPMGFLRLSPVVDLLAVEGDRAVMLWVYAGLGLVMTALAWVLYRFRHVERAGDPLAFSWARIAFRVCFTACLTLGFGWLLASVFGTYNGEKGDVFLPYAMIGCALGWFCSSMIVERSVKVFRNKKVWLGFAACVGVLILTVLGLKYDLLGWQHRIPAAEKISSVEIWTRDYGEFNSDCITLSDPQDVAVVRTFHAKAVDDPALERSASELLGRNPLGSVHILYHLEGGGTMRRVYEVNLNEREAQALAALFRKLDVVAAYYEEHLADDWTCATMETYYYDDYYGVSGSGANVCTDLKALRKAMLADAAAGRNPVINFMTEDTEPDTMRIYLEKWRAENGVSKSGRLEISSGATETLALFGVLPSAAPVEEQPDSD